MRTETKLEKSESLHVSIQFDCSGHFILYPTMEGIKLANIQTGECEKIIGIGDSLRPLYVCLFQDQSLEQDASENSILAQTSSDPTLFITVFK